MTAFSIQKFAIIACAITLCAGCVTTAPAASSGNRTAAQAVQSHSYAASYDKVWGVILAVLQEEEMTLSVVDKSSGIASGIKNVVPSTADMMMGYSVRTLVSVTATKDVPSGVKVTLRGSMERKYKKADWRPDTVTDTSEYVNSLYAKIAAGLR